MIATNEQCNRTPCRRTLHEITDDLLTLDDLLCEIEGDVSDPRVAEAVDAWFNEFETNLENKADNYAALIVELQHRSDARKAEADRMATLARRDANSAAFLKDKLKAALQLLGRNKVEGRRFRISVCNNGGKQPVDIHDPDAIPRDYCKHIPERYEPDADLIRDAIASGIEIKGAVLMDRGNHLRIK